MKTTKRYGKKGDLSLTTYYLTWTIVLAIIIIAFMQYASRISSDTRFDRIRASTDLSLTATAATIPSSNYAITLAASDTRLRLENGQAIAASTEEPKGPGGGTAAVVEEKTSYGLDTKLALTSNEIASRQSIEIIKDDDNIIARAKPEATAGQAATTPGLNRFRCPINPDISSLQAIIDPGHGGTAGAGDTGEQIETTTGKIIESEITTKIAQSIAANMRGTGNTAGLTRPDNSALETKIRLDRIGANAALISIHTHKSKAAGMATVTAYIKIDDKEIDGKVKPGSSALACALINALLKDKKTRDSAEPTFIGGNIAVIDTRMAASDDDIHTLDKPAAGVQLELNGIDLPADKNPIIGHEDEIGRQIAEAMMRTGATVRK